VKISALVFDLDDTLLDTTTLLIPIARTPEFELRIRQPLPLLPGAKENLDRLKKKYRLFLLTQGRKDAQEAKVKSCGLENFFEKVWIADPAKQEHKSNFFAELRNQLLQTDEQFMSIGNRRSTDLREAKKLGAMTCLFRYGEHQNELIECPEDIPDFVTDTHSELIRICNL
jgi:putative hydrolase of the HAD superfamily